MKNLDYWIGNIVGWSALLTSVALVSYIVQFILGGWINFVVFVGVCAILASMYFGIKYIWKVFKNE